jgi:hypothetical protein
MTNKDLFKEAIADAKQVREAALANAKVALEEALTPRLQSMLSTKLQEMESDSEEEDKMEEYGMGGYDGEVKENEVEEGFKTAHGQWDAEDDSDTLEEEFDLSEILAELDAELATDEEELDNELESEEEGLYEAKEEVEDEAGEETETEETETEEEVEVKDLTVDQLKDIIKDIVNQELESEEYESEEEETGEEIDLSGEEEMVKEERIGGDNEEIDLEELLAELDALDSDKNMSDDEMAMIRKKFQRSDDEILRDYEKGERAQDFADEAKMMKKDLKEAIETIGTLRSELQEVNLLNAKLLYVNKIFKAKNLTESQKVKVIASFDKAETAKEAKIVFESLESTLTATSGKSQIKESLGFASKAAGIAPKNQIVEVNDTLSRMQQLAGIK